MEELLKTLPELTTTVAVAVIGAGIIFFLVYYFSKERTAFEARAMEAHKEKTLEFIAHNKEKDALIKEMTTQHSEAFDKLSRAIDANTQATKKMEDTFTQFLINKRS